MRLLFCVLLILLCGCTQSSRVAMPAPGPTALTILEEVLVDPDFRARIAQAERDFPDDEWLDKPWRLNADRDRRERAVGSMMLASIEPKLDGLSVSDLVRSLKLLPHPDGFLTNTISGVASYVYVNGNRMIIDKIKSRPKNELKILTSLSDQHVGVFGYDQGYPMTLADVIKYEILYEEPSVK